MFKKKQKESLIEDLYNFLKILAENSRGHVKREDDSKYNVNRSEKHLSKIFGKERLESFIDLGFEQGYLRREKVNINDEDDYVLRIQGKGLKYLEEFERERRKEKHSRQMVLANWLLMIATFGLLITTFIAYNITTKSFESENRPFIYMEKISLKSFEDDSSVYQMDISNFGNFPGRIIEIKTPPENIGGYSLKNFQRTTVLKNGETVQLDINEAGMGNEFEMNFTIVYSGIGELSNKIYTYPFSVSVKKDDLKFSIHEGRI
ncbi:hypothetical protein COU60_04370 [Candidatus Pacearchaeota archaeon CG10_big_fil_rev_8_21_14_0_10_34_76]|nr:MAG: hypothetical protein COU60_04370 [Candidatus Pacearchaeota archaeon CG10_big_fil_rev_8_21_14_0_10_34_76]